MKRVDLNKSNLNPNFIGAWELEETSLCDNLIEYFELNRGKQKRGVGNIGLDLDTKNCTAISMLPNEINLPDNEVFKQYFHALFGCHKDYLEQWPFLAPFARNLEIGAFNLQRYKSGQHFQKIHTERFSLDTLHRVLAWMTYLNDVDLDAGGSTYFSHYDLAVQPRKGLTLIWPAEWTHAHKGSLIKAGSKHVITGWMNFSE